MKILGAALFSMILAATAVALLAVAPWALLTLGIGGLIFIAVLSGSQD
jgi:hypothetical protein